MSIDDYDRIRTLLSLHNKHDDDGAPTRVSEPNFSDVKLVDAAVLIALLRRESEINILLTRRNVHLAHHAGQIALPGGRVADTDSDMLTTALREAQEEIGLSPELVEILGRCACHHTTTGFRIFPFVAAVNPEFQPILQLEEVESLFEIPLEYLADLRNFETGSGKWQGKVRRYLFINYKSHHIWGATAAILFDFVTRLKKERSTN